MPRDATRTEGASVEPEHAPHRTRVERASTHDSASSPVIPYIHFTTLNLPPILPSRVAMSNPFLDNPPPLPPKSSAPSRRQQHQSHQQTRSNTRNDPSHAHHHHSRSADTPPRSRPHRSQTTGPYVMSESLSLCPFVDIRLLPLSKQPIHHYLLSSSAYPGGTFPFYGLVTLR